MKNCFFKEKIQHLKHFIFVVLLGSTVSLSASSPPLGRPKEVVIIGAGIAGLATGILLKEEGISVKIYEKRGGIESIGGALSIWPIGSKVLLGLPCASEISKLAGDLRFEKWGNEDGKTLMTFDREILGQINGFPFMNICRSELQELLLSSFGKDNIIFNATCTKISEEECSTFAHFSNGDIISEYS